MEKLVTAALLLALAGGAHADAPALAAPVEKPGKAAAPKRTGAKPKEKQKDKRGVATPTPPPKAPDGKGEKPCEPVKPCPID